MPVQRLRLRVSATERSARYPPAQLPSYNICRDLSVCPFGDCPRLKGCRLTGRERQKVSIRTVRNRFGCDREESRFLGDLYLKLYDIVEFIRPLYILNRVCLSFRIGNGRLLGPFENIVCRNSVAGFGDEESRLVASLFPSFP